MVITRVRAMNPNKKRCPLKRFASLLFGFLAAVCSFFWLEEKAVLLLPNSHYMAYTHQRRLTTDDYRKGGK